MTTLSALDPNRRIYSPSDLSTLLGQKHQPTQQQAAVIGADPHSSFLVTAGAGAGKTETMAARVVWLVANGYVLPEEVLGLTFTRKAAAELGKRIRERLTTLAHSRFVDELSPTDPRRDVLRAIQPAVSTYDSFAGNIVGEYGLLIPIEPTGRIITDAERWMIARDVVLTWAGELTVATSVNSLIDAVLTLSDEMDNHLVTLDEVQETTKLAQLSLEELPKNRGKWSQDNVKFHDSQIARLELLPIVESFRERLRDQHVRTFGQQMSLAARVAQAHARVGEEQRRRYRVVLLDEYQDTGHAQRILLRTLFGQGQDPQLSVTAVGDPMQSIYMFRGATASNLEKFRSDFPQTTGEPAPKLELTTSWRNPGGVLTLANAVSDWSMDTGRLVSELTPRPGAEHGDIKLAFFDNEIEEVEWLAEALAARWEEYQNGPRDEPFSAAVLVRKNKQALPVFEALRERGVPAEMTAGPGLLDIPEVADVYAVLQVLVDPEDDPSMLRLLTGPRVNLGASDIAVLARRAAQLHRNVNTAHTAPSDKHSSVADGNAQPELGLAAEVSNAGGKHPLAGLPQELIAAFDEALPRPHDMPVGLADAIADFTDAVDQGMSESGAQRIRELSQELGYLRRYSLSKPLPDLVADIENMIGVRTEVLTRWHQDSDSSIGTSHLDAFSSIVRSFSDISGSSPAALVEYLRAAHDKEDGLEPGEVSKKLNTVQILTVHKSKGLEWDIVAVPFAHRKTYCDASQPDTEAVWTRNSSALPTELRGDSEPDPTGAVPMPILDTSEFTTAAGQIKQVENSAHHKNAVEEFATRFKQFSAKESDRVFYVAITRTERVLLVSGSVYSPNSKEGRDPAVLLAKLRDHAADGEVLRFVDGGKKYSATFYKDLAKRRAYTLTRECELLAPSEEDNEKRSVAEKAWAQRVEAGEFTRTDTSPVWPRPRTNRWDEARALITQAWADAEPSSAGTPAQHDNPTQQSTPTQLSASGQLNPPTQQSAIATQWDRETTLLIEEFQRQATPEVVVPLGTRLTATEAVALRRDPEEFARRRRRPVPLEPKPFAKRGTAFHNWVEQHYGHTSLLDDEQLPGASDSALNDPELEQLKEAFLRSSWAQIQPYSVEGAYSVSLGGAVFEGRIDAVFHSGDDMTDGWMVVDWKTGRKPQGKEMEAAEMQLGVYRLAWAKVLSRTLGVTVPPEGVRAAFHYVKDNLTVEPRTLPTAEELAQALVLPTQRSGE